MSDQIKLPDWLIPAYIIPRDEDPLPTKVQTGEWLYIAIVNRAYGDPPFCPSPGVAVMWGQICPDCHELRCQKPFGWNFMVN